ncbi:hypothetical protein NUW58_g2590 [Xylaria curta]|uniref:Uncharacterized protein n=1 Tax=Xylaria curta TaxID=42375 RepID=A0ACC1PEV3_9PEZI|nr:hypothetical protein NUW58_g2590 [Xylaria curta]
MSDYFHSVTSTKALQQRHPVPLCELDAKLPSGKNTPRSNDFLSDQAIEALLQQTPDLCDWTENGLVEKHGVRLGQFWAALAEVVPLDDTTRVKQNHERPSSPLGQPTPKRNRVAVNHADMVDSTTLQIGSSSPAQPSSQASSRDDAFVAADGDLSMTREFNTQYLLSCFVRCVLYSIPSNDWEKKDQMEVRPPVTASVDIGDDWSVQAEDDGGLRRRPGHKERSPTHPYGGCKRSRDLVYCYDALFETKRGFGQINNGRPSISDKWLGQMTAEALVGRITRAKRYAEE